MTLALKLGTFVSNIFRSERQRKPPAFTASSNKRKAFLSPDMKAQQSPMIAKSILLMLTWKTNTQLNDETGNPCLCVFFLQFLIWNLTSLCHLKVVLLQCSAVVLKIKIICLSGGLLLRPCSQDWRLRGWLTKARRNAWHEDTSSFLPFLQICSLWGALEDQQAEVHTVSVWCKTLDSSFFLIFLFFNHLPWCSPLCTD